MFKSNNMYIVESENLSLENIIPQFCQGADIVFITDQEKLIGGVTKGDMHRKFRDKGGSVSPHELVNTKITSIVFESEEKVYQNAKVVFENNNKINNIPVVDGSKKLLFQINRSENKDLIKDIENILEAEKNGSLEIFLESSNIKEVILTGADNISLEKVKIVLNKECERMGDSGDISVVIESDLLKCCIAEKGKEIISISDLGAWYINRITNFEAKVISSRELVAFKDFPRVEKLNESIIDAWKNVYGYEVVVFCMLNKYILQLKRMLKECGVQVFQINEYQISGNSTADNMECGLDVFLYSNGGEYCEVLKVTEFIKILEWIWRYKQITGHDLVADEYFGACMKYLNGLHDLGFDGFYCEVNNIWKKRLVNRLQNDCKMEIITELSGMSDEKKYIIDSSKKCPLSEGSFVCAMSEWFLIYICEMAIYQLFNKMCRNIYIYSAPFYQAFYQKYEIYVDRTRDNYLKQKEVFSESFVKDMYGDENYPIDEVLLDMKECQTVKINDGYVKYASNYHSKYFNTDTYGSRIVIDTPTEYHGTIWLVGGCNFSGYAVEDKFTFASYLQSRINKSDYLYRVVDLSCDGAATYTLYNKVLDRNIAPDDIIIILEHALFLKDKTVQIDYEKISDSFQNRTWYWDSIGHPNHIVYDLLAGEFFEAIKSDMVTAIVDSKFYVERDLDFKIQNFVMELKSKIRKNKNFQEIYHKGTFKDVDITSEREKIGAIVMNCNPFTYGHQYLIETASRMVDLLIVFVVEEDKSIFKFEDRFDMVQDGIAQYDNVVAFPSGDFMISTITFPGYFLKEMPTKKCYDSFLDLKIFAHYIAPVFGISMRFVGEEPFDKVTASYNYDMKKILGDAGINVIEIPRKRQGNEYISATKVRKLIKERNYDVIEKYVPETTMKYIKI